MENRSYSEGNYNQTQGAMSTGNQNKNPKKEYIIMANSQNGNANSYAIGTYQRIISKQNLNNNNIRVPKASNNSYTNAFTTASNGHNSPNQHLVDSNLEGSLLGIMEVETMQHHIYRIRNKDFVSFPFKDVQYEFYVEVPISFGKKLYYKFRPYVRERIVKDSEFKTKNVGFSSALIMETIDTVDELPFPEDYTYSPLYPTTFKITNMRQSLGDNTYHFYLNDIEVAELFDDEENAFVNSDFSMVLQLFDHHNTKIDKYTKEFEKLSNKILKKFGEDVYRLSEVPNGICVGDWVENSQRQVIAFRDYADGMPTGEMRYVTINNNEDWDNIYIEKIYNSKTSDGVYDNQILKLVKGLNQDNNALYYALFIGGDIRACYKFLPQ